MPQVRSPHVTIDVRLVHAGRLDVLPRREWPRAEATPDALRELARQRTGADAFLLHDGGLRAGLPRVTALLETHDPERDRPALTSPVSATAPLPPHARRWQRPGWYAATTAWLRGRLAERGERLAGAIEQVSTYDLACVLRAPSSGGRVYLKAAESPHEALVTRHLARSRPELIPEVLAVDARRNLLLTRDAGAPLHEDADPQAWIEAVTKLALLHRDAPRTGSAPRARRHDYARLPGRARVLLRDGPALRGWGLPEEAVADLADVVPIVEAAHRRVEALRLAAGFAHGDAHPMNARVGPRGVAWFDLHEAGEAHPLLDAGWFLAWLAHPARAELPVRLARPDVVRELWRAYLDTLGAPEAEDLLDDAVVLALAHRAVAFHRRFRSWEGTLPGWRPQGAPYHLKWLRRDARRSVLEPDAP